MLKRHFNMIQLLQLDFTHPKDWLDWDFYFFLKYSIPTKQCLHRSVCEQNLDNFMGSILRVKDRTGTLSLRKLKLVDDLEIWDRRPHAYYRYAQAVKESLISIYGPILQKTAATLGIRTNEISIHFKELSDAMCGIQDFKLPIKEEPVVAKRKSCREAVSNRPP